VHSPSAIKMERRNCVNKGMIYFALSALPQPLQFRTAAGVIDVEQLILNAASDGGLLKGYISATPERTELGVFEGGSMLVLTPKEETLIKSGKRIILAQQIEEEEDDDVSRPFLDSSWNGGRYGFTWGFIG